MPNCYIVQGISLACDVSTGGIKKVYILGGSDTAAVTGYTYDADGAITGATSATGSTFFEFQLKRDTSSLSQTISKSYENSSLFFEQVLNIVLYKYDIDKRNMVLSLAKNDALTIIAVDFNDVQYLLGQVNGLSLGGNITTGTNMGDRNGFELTFTGREPEPARTITGDLATVFTGVSFE